MPKLVSNVLCSQVCPWVSFLASTSHMLLLTCATNSSLVYTLCKWRLACMAESMMNVVETGVIMAVIGFCGCWMCSERACQAHCHQILTTFDTVCFSHSHTKTCTNPWAQSPALHWSTSLWPRSASLWPQLLERWRWEEQRFKLLLTTQYIECHPGLEALSLNKIIEEA